MSNRNNSVLVAGAMPLFAASGALEASFPALGAGCRAYSLSDKKIDSVEASILPGVAA